MSKLLLLTSLALMAAAPVTPEATAPAPPKAQTVEHQKVMLPEPLQALKDAYSERLSRLQAEFAQEKNPARALKLQRQIRNEKLGFEADVLAYQLERATTAQKTTQVEQLQKALDMIRRLMNDELEEDLEPASEGDR